MKNICVANIDGRVELDPILIELLHGLFNFANEEGLKGVVCKNLHFERLLDRIYVTVDVEKKEENEIT